MFEGLEEVVHVHRGCGVKRGDTGSLDAGMRLELPTLGVSGSLIYDCSQSWPGHTLQDAVSDMAWFLIPAQLHEESDKLL